MKGKQEQRGRSAAKVWLKSSLHQGLPSTELRLSCIRSKMERFSWWIMSVSQKKACLWTAPSCCHHGEDGTRQPQVSVTHPGDTPGHQLLNPLPLEHSELKTGLVSLEITINARHEGHLTQIFVTGLFCACGKAPWGTSSAASQSQRLWAFKHRGKSTILLVNSF